MFRSYTDTIRTPVKASKEASKKYLCDLCDNDHSWESESDVEIHRRRAHNFQLLQLMKEPKNNMCSVCLRQQADRTALIAHIKTDHLLSSPDASRVKREIYACNYCTHIFFNKTLLETHVKCLHLYTSTQKKKARTLCPICKKKFKIKSIWFHLLYHGVMTTGTCPICLTLFDDYQEVLKHVECHPGSYCCDICTYETNKESLFLSHVEKHKRIVNLGNRKDVNAVSRFFIPEKKFTMWNRKVVNVFKGITLSPEIQICILCRTMCDTEEQMLQHIYGDHSPLNKVEIPRYICACGEEFFNRVLLKHHVFMLKGVHRVFESKEKEPVSIQKPAAKKQSDDVQANVGKEIVNKNDNVAIHNYKANKKSTGTIIATVSKLDSTSNATGKAKTDADIEKQTKNDTATQSEDITELQIEIQSQNEKNETQTENNESHIEIEIRTDMVVDPQPCNITESHSDTESQNDIESYNDTESQNDIESQNDTESQNDIEMQPLSNNVEEAAKITKNTRNFNVHDDKILIDGRYYTVQLSDAYQKSISSEGINVELVATKEIKEVEVPPPRVKKRVKQDILLLKGALSKRFKSTKQFYEQVLSMNDDSNDSVKSSEVDGNESEQVQSTEPTQEVHMYEVIEVLGTSTADTQEMDENAVDPLLFS